MNAIAMHSRRLPVAVIGMPNAFSISSASLMRSWMPGFFARKLRELALCEFAVADSR
jgi:hypothetical protein